MKHLSGNNYNQNKLTNVPDAVDAQDAVNKGQLDGKIDGVNIGKVTVSTATPSSPSEGDVWINPSAVVPAYTPGPASITPAMRTGGISSGVIPAEFFGSTGIKSAVTGLGYTPKRVRFTLLAEPSSTAARTCIGSATSSANQFISATSVVSGTYRVDTATTACVGRLSATTGWSMLARFVSMDADGFTLNVSIASSSLIVGVYWEAEA